MTASQHLVRPCECVTNCGDSKKSNEWCALGGPPKKATPKPNYEAWRISYQSSEAAARAAWEEMTSLHQRLQKLEAYIAALTGTAQGGKG